MGGPQGALSVGWLHILLFLFQGFCSLDLCVRVQGMV